MEKHKQPTIIKAALAKHVQRSKETQTQQDKVQDKVQSTRQRTESGFVAV